MAKVVPFRGLRFSSAQIKDPGSVMAPPYDVITPAMQEDLYQRNRYNIVRLILGKSFPDDNRTDNRYTRAAAEFAEWQQNQVLVRDSEPSIYLYDQEYRLPDGSVAVRQGVVALARLEDFASGVVKPHEQTLEGLKSDRFDLLRACQANFSPIFSLYSDPCCVVEAVSRRERDRAPDLQVRDDSGVVHRLWQVAEPGIIRKIQDLLNNKALFIADGHHRYETSLSYRDYMRQKHPDFTGKELFNYVQMYFSNMDDQGTVIFPTHRLVSNLPEFRLEALLVKLGQYFEIDRLGLDPGDPESRRATREELARRGEGGSCLGLLGGDRTLYFLRLKDPAVMDVFFDEKAPKASRLLDVSILHRLILESLLGIGSTPQEQQAHLQYVTDFDEPFERVLAKDCQLAFLMNPTRLNQVREVANAGVKMPPNSTFFFPELLSGLVINKVVEGETVGE